MRARARARGDKGRELLEHVAEGAELDQGEEVSALDWLLGDQAPAVHDIEARIDTDKGLRTIVFVVPAFDSKKIDAIEERNLNKTTLRLNRTQADIEIVTEASALLCDPSGKEISPRSAEFRTVRRPGMEPVEYSSTYDAMEARFRTQLGVLSNVANEIRRLAGYSTDRVDPAKRRVEASRLVSASLD